MNIFFVNQRIDIAQQNNLPCQNKQTIPQIKKNLIRCDVIYPGLQNQNLTLRQILKKQRNTYFIVNLLKKQCQHTIQKGQIGIKWFQFIDDDLITSRSNILYCYLRYLIKTSDLRSFTSIYILFIVNLIFFDFL
ncbi:unnamed protein product [Paramecium octaurelia]|uniref:Transmembrane protein n=1 Tax=Paramecium octaurelia TaxID=43137 RepID=A0A8S1YDM8_PAROT|nr:unnamed protein product [Paramecium octaurelia]